VSSYGWQALYGSKGILPADAHLRNIEHNLGDHATTWQKFWALPTVGHFVCLVMETIVHHILVVLLVIIITTIISSSVKLLWLIINSSVPSTKIIIGAMAQGRDA
jgi:hypothetical protein